jgi:DNA polymerase-1
MQIHDELVLECRAEQAEDVAGLVRREMEGAMALKVPLKVDVAWGKNWFEGK